MQAQKYKISAISLALSAIFSNLAFADDGHAHETITVLGETYRNTATKTSLDPEETPQALSIVTQDELNTRGASSISEAVRYTSGIHTDLRGGMVTRFDLFNIRGFTNYTNFYDGLPLPYNNFFLQPQIDTVAVEQIEVFKGPTSVLYGNMPPGGMVNIIAKSPQKQSAHSVGVSAGTNNLQQAKFDSTGQIGDSDFTYRIVGLARKKDGQVDTSKEERYVIAPSLDWQVTDNTLINFNAYYQDDPEGNVFTSVPASGSVLSNPVGKLSPDTFLGDENWSMFDRQVLLVGYKILHNFNNQWQFLQNARFMDASMKQEEVFNSFLMADNRTMARTAFATDEEVKSFVIDNQLSGYFETGSIGHNLLIGIDYQSVDTDVFGKQTSPLVTPLLQDIFNPNTNSIDRDTLFFAGDRKTEVDMTQLGVYLQDQFTWNNLVMVAGLRWDSVESDTKAVENNYVFATTTNNTEKIDDTNISMRVGALYQFDNGIHPYASYSESFEPISGVDAAGRAFEPSTGEQWEVGVKYAPLTSGLQASVALFHITKEKAMLNDPDNLSAPRYQAGEIVSQGAELEAKWQASEQLDLTANYTYVDMEITKDDFYNQEGRTPVWVPEQTASLWGNYYFTDTLNGLRLSTGVRYVGEAQLDPQNSDTVPDYTLVDAAASYVFSSLDDTTLTVSATNLFDKEYFSCYDQISCWYGEERTIEASIDYSF